MDTTIKGLIIVLVLLLILVGIVYYAYRTIRRKIRRFSYMAFGTGSLLRGLGQGEAEYMTTPKSVSSATGLYLPRIMKDFPDFHYDEMKIRAENVLVSYLRSIDAQNSVLLTEGTAELKDRLMMRLEMMKSQGYAEHFSQMKIHRTEIFQYRKQKGRCSIIFQSAIEYFQYIKDKEGNIKNGSPNNLKQTRYNIECIYIQDRDLVEDIRDAALGLNCPNCGGPISGVGAKVCVYCNTPIVDINIRSWNFSHVEEV